MNLTVFSVDEQRVPPGTVDYALLVLKRKHRRPAIRPIVTMNQTSFLESNGTLHVLAFDSAHRPAQLFYRMCTADGTRGELVYSDECSTGESSSGAGIYTPYYDLDSGSWLRNVSPKACAHRSSVCACAKLITHERQQSHTQSLGYLTRMLDMISSGMHVRYPRLWVRDWKDKGWFCERKSWREPDWVIIQGRRISQWNTPDVSEHNSKSESLFQESISRAKRDLHCTARMFCFMHWNGKLPRISNLCQLCGGLWEYPTTKYVWGRPGAGFFRKNKYKRTCCAQPAWEWGIGAAGETRSFSCYSLLENVYCSFIYMFFHAFVW